MWSFKTRTSVPNIVQDARKSDRLRDQDRPSVLGYELDRDTLTPKRKAINFQGEGDYGADPLGNGKFRMVPSGDVVDLEERNNRLKKRNSAQDAAGSPGMNAQAHTGLAAAHKKRAAFLWKNGWQGHAIPHVHAGQAHEAAANAVASNHPDASKLSAMAKKLTATAGDPNQPLQGATTQPRPPIRKQPQGAVR